jgi:hypothetical protein
MPPNYLAHSVGGGGGLDDYQVYDLVFGIKNHRPEHHGCLLASPAYGKAVFDV